MTALVSPFIIKDGDDAITLLGFSVSRTARGIAPIMTMWRGRVRCE